jgi:hypothetical protein
MIQHVQRPVPRTGSKEILLTSESFGNAEHGGEPPAKNRSDVDQLLTAKPRQRRIAPPMQRQPAATIERVVRLTFVLCESEVEPSDSGA